jgi:hypothetical protein
MREESMQHLPVIARLLSALQGPRCGGAEPLASDEGRVTQVDAAYEQEIPEP